MSDLKISQLPAASALTGTELVELVQGGQNAQSTPGSIAALATPSSVLGIFSGGNWGMGIAAGNSGTMPTLLGPYAGQPSQSIATITGGISAHAITPSATTLYGAMGMILPQTSASTNVAAEFAFASQAYLYSFRKLSGGVAAAGFTMTLIAGFDTTRSDQTAFLGMASVTNFGNAGIVSNQLNIVGFGKDQGDANLQFMVNNGAGAAAKTDTGLVFTNLTRHLFKITITCDAAGALITATIQDLEPASPFATATYTVANAAAKNIVADVKIGPRLYVGTGTATATICGMAFSSLFVANSALGA